MKSMDVAKQDEFCLFWVWFPGTFAVVLHEQWHRSGMGVGCRGQADAAVFTLTAALAEVLLELHLWDASVQGFLVPVPGAGCLFSM